MHTPGPWKVYPNTMQVEDWRVNIGDSDGDIACAYHKNDDPDKPDEETLANARLIASAPDMLEALKALLAAGPYGNADAYNKAVDEARAAVAAAEGRG